MYAGPTLSHEQIATLEAFAPVWIVSVDGGKVSSFSASGRTLVEVLPGTHRIELAYLENNDGSTVVPGGRVHYSSRLYSKQNAVLNFDAKASFGEVESVADGATDAVERGPFDERGVHAALQNEILDQPSHVIVRKCRTDRRAQSETAP